MSSNSPIYRFILTPLDRIFFGGEKTPFEQDEYFLHSRYFPQQTGLLGMVRYFILQKSGLLNGNKVKWDALIGPASFSGDPNQGFGLIERLSPLSIFSQDEKDWYFMRDTRNLHLEDAPSHVRVALGETPGYRDNIGYLRGYNPKANSQLAEVLSDLQGHIIPVLAQTPVLNRTPSGQYPGVFFQDVKPGITKNYAGDPKEDGYFKLMYYKMAPGYSYSFKAQIKESPDGIPWEGSSFIRMGGDSSFYRLEVQKTTNWEVSTGQGTIFHLLSDAITSNSIYDLCKHWAADTLLFRNMKTTSQDTHYNKRPSWDGVRRGATFGARRLLRRGSILAALPGREEDLKKALKSPAFETIGYNHFIRTNNPL
jgi:hypothetical protein